MPSIELFTRTIPREVYVTLLLRIPSVYFRSVFKVFASPRGEMKDPSEFLNLWKAFVDRSVGHWQTFTIVTVLVLQAIIALIQIPDVSEHPVTRTAALLSMVSALWSIVYTCLYIMRFGTMSLGNNAERWAKESRTSSKNIIWNAWVMLSMPAAWLAWSLIFFFVAIISYICTTGTSTETISKLPGSDRGAWGLRIPVITLFALGVIYFVLVIRTLNSFSDDDMYTFPRSWTRVEFEVDRTEKRPPPFSMPSDIPGPSGWLSDTEI
ncbi:hypothetical protein BD410DRAFT_883483 [Rickenella mellea]|uniref:Uncharacterized protein n=1 Tax=Rickenella mellea TaxID=50990 RepID=A0A4Y7PQT4_9AGAM|nr:hypothetical protein BD410DRAFT_883483 [Rickenella mellea]